MSRSRSEPDLEFRILGPIEALRGEIRLHLGGPKVRSLLGILLAHPNQVVAAGRLIDLLWGDEPPETAAKVLQVYVSQLRKALEPARGPGREPEVLVSRSPGYMLRVEPGSLDVDRFDRLSREGRRRLEAGDPAGARALLEQALRLWRGPVLADLESPNLRERETRRWEERRLAAEEDRLEALLAEGDQPAAVADLRRLAEANPLRERLWRLLMLALYRSGRQAEASDAYHRLRRRLADELGMEPGPELQRLFRAILKQDPALTFGQAPAPAGAERLPPAGNLPHRVTTFVGRRTELGNLRERLARTRLLTLTGPGGIGKSSLAIRLGVECRPDFPDGVWLAELGGVRHPEALPEAVAAALGLRVRRDLPLEAALASFVAGRRLLLVLDQAEHLIDACAWLVIRLLEASAELRVVVTCRERLNVPGEQVAVVGPLPVPDSAGIGAADPTGSEAVELFLDRAANVDLDLAQGLALDQVAEICRRLEGIPLAIELAAAQLHLLTVQQLTERLADRLDLPAPGRRGGMPRHQTLRAAIDWSYDLLSPAERALFARLSVFAGGWTLEHARGVCGFGELDAERVPELIGRLRDKSLVMSRDRGPTRRFDMLDVLREYGRERAREVGDWREAALRHGRLVRDLAAGLRDGAQDETGRRVLERLWAEHDNLRAALALQLELGAEVVMAEIAAAWWPFWWLGGHWREGRHWLEAALAIPGLEARLRLRLLNGAGRLAVLQGDPERGAVLFAEAVALSRAIGDQERTASFLNSSANAALRGGDHLAARELYAESLALFERLGSPTAAVVLGNLGNAAAHAGDLDRARDHLQQAIRFHAERADLGGRLTAELNLADLEVMLDHLGAAARLAADVLAAAGGAPNDLNIEWEALDTLASVALAAGRAPDGVRLAAAADRLRDRAGATRWREPWKFDLAGRLEQAAQELGADRARSLSQEGAAMTRARLLRVASELVEELT